MNAIERIEVLKNYIPTVQFGSNQYPQIKIMMDKELGLHPSSDEILTLQKLLLELAEGFEMKDINQQFFSRIGQGISLSQGFGNYKRFLELLGWLDEVYDKEVNHAFLK